MAISKAKLIDNIGKKLDLIHFHIAIWRTGLSVGVCENVDEAVDQAEYIAKYLRETAGVFEELADEWRSHSVKQRRA